VLKEVEKRVYPSLSNPLVERIGKKNMQFLVGKKGRIWHTREENQA
jgi:hypothetical protein